MAYCKTCITHHPSPSLLKNKPKTSFECYGCCLLRLNEIPVSAYLLLFQSPMHMMYCHCTKGVLLCVHLCLYVYVCVHPRVFGCVCVGGLVRECMFCLHVCVRTCHTILLWDHCVPHQIGTPVPPALYSLYSTQEQNKTRK